PARSPIVSPPFGRRQTRGRSPLVSPPRQAVRLGGALVTARRVLLSSRDLPRGLTMPSHDPALDRARRPSAAILGLIVGFALLGAGAASGCEVPPLAAVPAAKDVGGKQKDILADVQRYHEAMTAYTDCLKKELTAAGGDGAPPLLKTILVNRYNSAVAEV